MIRCSEEEMFSEERFNFNLSDRTKQGPKHIRVGNMEALDGLVISEVGTWCGWGPEEVGWKGRADSCWASISSLPSRGEQDRAYTARNRDNHFPQ
jgi:hypothetical protein